MGGQQRASSPAPGVVPCGLSAIMSPSYRRAAQPMYILIRSKPCPLLVVGPERSSRQRVQHACQVMDHSPTGRRPPPRSLWRDVLAYCAHGLKRLRIWWRTLIIRSKRLPIFYTVPTCQRREFRSIVALRMSKLPPAPITFVPNSCCALHPRLDKLFFFP